MSKNPYHKYLGREDHLQHLVMRYLSTQYSDVLSIHVPNEGKRSPFMQYKFKYLGGLSGIPDVLVFRATDHYSGLALELKIAPNKPTKNQKLFLEKLSNAGWYATWTNSFEEAKSIIDQYLNNHGFI